MRRNNFYILFLIAYFIPRLAAAQSAVQTVGSYRLADEAQIWRLTGNAAALSLDPERCDSSANRGVAYFRLMHQGGDYHRVQEGGMQNHLQFFTERYQKIGRYLYGFGSFSFDMGRTKERAWSDVMRSYNSNPFISGSSVFGKYDNQDFALSASLSTIQLGAFTYGASLQYKAGDLSRLRDPRSRINLAQYRISPAITYTFGSSATTPTNGATTPINGATNPINGATNPINGATNPINSSATAPINSAATVPDGSPSGAPRHTLALALHYDRRKEKLPNLTTVQTDPNLAYYVMTGLENATGTIGGYNGYMREYVDHELGMELSYGMKTASLHSVTSLSIDGGREYVYGTNKYEPGTYRNYVYGLSTRNRIGASDKLHSIDLSLKYETGAADEYKEERISETDGTTGYTSVRWQKIMEYKKRYQLKKLDMDLSYRLTFTDGQESKGYAGAACTVQSVSNKHLLYTSELQYASTLLSLEGGLPLLDSRLWIEGKASYNIASKADLSLHDATTPYAVGVLLPDMAYYDANYAQGCLKVTWQQPIVIKGYKSQWFASLQGNYLKTDNSLNRYNVALSVGLLY